MAELMAGKYDVVERLATGGMAEVFLARVRGPAAFERRCVIKRVLPHLVSEEEFTKLFELEARYAALIEHPNIAQVYDFGRDADGRPWLAMEYVDGASLRQLLRAMAERNEQADVRLVARVFAQAAEGLAAAHALVDPETREPLHLVHRDVSPENILVSRLGAVKVSDFGIARAMVKAGTTRPDTVRGKLRYLSPEQIRGEETTLAVDVWALGVSLFEALTGVRPFPEDNEGQTVHAIASGLRPTVTSLRTDCPAALVAIVDRCLEVDPARRMPDCHELALALDRFVAASGAPISTSMVGSWVDRLAPRRTVSPKDRPWLPEVLTPGAPAARTPPPSTPKDPDDFVPTSAFDSGALAADAEKPLELAPPVAHAPGAQYTPGRSVAQPPANADMVRTPGGRVIELVPEPRSNVPAPAPAPEQEAQPAPAPATTTGAPAPETEAAPARRLPAWAFALLALVLGAGGFFGWRRAFPPPPEPARVFVSSTPSGATVKVNGAPVGTTPWGGDIPGTTPIAVEVEAPGFAKWETTLEPGVPSTVDATLKKKR